TPGAGSDRAVSRSGAGCRKGLVSDTTPRTARRVEGPRSVFHASWPISKEAVDKLRVIHPTFASAARRQQQVGRLALVAFQIHAQVQGQAGEVGGEAFGVRVGIQVKQFEVALAAGTALGTDWGLVRGVAVAFQAGVVQVLAGVAMHALDPHEVPFAGAQRADQITQALLLAAMADDSGHGRRAAAR